MSGKVFKGKLGDESAKRGVIYKPAILTYDPNLIKKLLRQCYSGNPLFIIGKPLSEEFSKLITNHVQEDFDPRQFLDAVVAEASTVRGLSSFSYLDDFLTPVVQALYSLDYNSFELDLSFCETGGEKVSLGTALKGKPGKLLEVRYTGISPHYVSKYNEFSKVTIDGAAKSVGLESEWSEFIVTKKLRLSALADAGSNCVFRLAEPDPCELMFCDYLDYMADDPYEPVLTYLKNKGFFERGNKLYFPDSKDKWKEVESP